VGCHRWSLLLILERSRFSTPPSEKSTGLGLGMSKWAVDDHFPLLSEKQMNNKVRIEHQPENQSIDFFFKRKNSGEHVPKEPQKFSYAVCPLLARQ